MLLDLTMPGMPAPERRKLGRNDPCHCGSGKKYKRCHLDHDRQPPQVSADHTSVQVIELIQQRKTQFDAEYKQPALSLRRAFMSRIGRGLEGREAAEALEEYLGQVEAKIGEIVARRSRLFWVHLSRRIPPVPIEGSSPWTTALYRTILSLALLRYGQPYQGIDELVMDPATGFLRPQDLKYEDCRDIYDLEYLALEFNDAATAYRRVGKGAILRPVSETDYSTEASTDRERLMQLLDRRVAQYDSLFSAYGSALDVAPAVRAGETADRIGIAFAALNVAQQEFPPEVAAALHVASLGPMNYNPAFLAVAPIRDLLSLFESKIIEVLGVSPVEILDFLSAVGFREWVRMQREPVRAVQFLQRAYWITRRDGELDITLDEIASYYQIILDKDRGRQVDLETARSDVRRVFAAVTYSEDEFAQISLWDKAPYKLVMPHGDYLVWDYSSVPYFLRGLLSQIAFLSGEVGNMKSAKFEEEVVALIHATPGVELWESQKELRAPDGSVRQIDASFVRGDVLYVVECKAFSAQPRIDRGDWAALRNRWAALAIRPPDERGKNGSYLHQARTLVEFLMAHPEGKAYPGSTPYRVPEHVTRIEHCLCTPLAEYIPDTSPEFWFDAETPRICVPSELLQFAMGEKPPLPDARSIPRST
jgi:hypothetical protein